VAEREVRFFLSYFSCFSPTGSAYSSSFAFQRLCAGISPSSVFLASGLRSPSSSAPRSGDSFFDPRRHPLDHAFLSQFRQISAISFSFPLAPDSSLFTTFPSSISLGISPIFLLSGRDFLFLFSPVEREQERLHPIAGLGFPRTRFKAMDLFYT